MGLLDLEHTERDPEDLVASTGQVLQMFDHRTQDSGNVSWLVRTDHGDVFVKTAGADPAPAGAPTPYFNHSGRVELLRNAVEVANSVDHPSLARLRSVIESPSGPILVYDRAPGELVHVPSEFRSDPDTAYQRFAQLPGTKQMTVFDELVQVHAALEEAGWVAVDLYDGCLMVEDRLPDLARLTLIDLDAYRRGPSINDMGRMFGSSLFMAPEEFELGAPIDARTTVFTLGRLIRHFGTRLTEDLDRFSGGDRCAAVIDRATQRVRSQRFSSVAELDDAWSDARTSPARA